MKVYQLEYYLMCGVDGSVDDKATWEKIEAENDKSAVLKANEFLKEEFYDSPRTSIIPWSPWLYDGQRLVAFSEPAYPPCAHRLWWINVPREFISA